MTNNKHNVWLILGVSIAIIALLFLVLYSPAREAIFGKAIEIPTKTCQVDANCALGEKCIQKYCLTPEKCTEECKLIHETCLAEARKMKIELAQETEKSCEELFSICSSACPKIKVPPEEKIEVPPKEVVLKEDFDGDGVLNDIDACNNNQAPSGLVSYWGFEEGWGAKTAYDSYNINHGTISGAITMGGQVGQALIFDSGEYVKIPHSDNLNFGLSTDTFTIEAWISTAYEESRIIEKVNNPNKKPFYLHLSKGKPYFGASFLVNNRYVAGAKDISDGYWHHLVGVKTKDFLISYVDGTQKTAVRYDITDDLRLASGEEGDIYIGNYFRGRIDEVAIYNRALTEEEILFHYNNGLGRSYCEEYTPPIRAPPVEALLGDVNGDGQINTDDAILILKYKVGLVTLNSEEIKRANVDCSLEKDPLTPEDAILILKKMINLIAEFPCTIT